MEQNGLNLKNCNQWALISFALIGFIVGYGVNEVIAPSSAGGGSPTVANQPAPSAPAPAAAPRAGVPIANAAELDDDDPSMGKGKVMLVEFTDYQCPFCGRHNSQTLGQIKEEYVDTNKIKYVVRDYPLGFHQNAQKASEASECADDQGKFWEMHDKLFANQQSLDVASLKRFAGELGLNQSEFDSCLDSDKYAQEVKDDMADGTAAGITGTPGFVLVDKDGNGTKISGAQPFASFKAAIDAAL